LLPVPGVFYLNAAKLPASVFLPALTIGFFSAGVLNLNNTRDIENDRNSGKITIPVRIGAQNSRIYHTFLITGGWVTAIIYTALHFQSYWQLIYLITLPLFMVDLVLVFRIQNNKALDPFLKKLALSTLAFTLLFCIGLVISVK
jgi:1,4-dihydroxy-2-naphthoate octaprenyltransferase